MVKTGDGAEGVGIAVVDHHGFGRRRVVALLAQRFQTLEHVVQRVNTFAFCEMGEKRLHRGHARLRRNVRDHSPLPFALFEFRAELRKLGNQLARGAEAHVRERAGGHDCERHSARRAQPPEALDRGDPKKRDERRGIVRAERPFGISPREQVLEQQRRRDQQPARAQQRQQQEWKEQRPNHVALRERAPQRAASARRLDEKIAHDLAAVAPEVRVKLAVVHVAGVQLRADHRGADRQPARGNEHRRHIPPDHPRAAARPFQKSDHAAKRDEQQRHVFLAREHGEKPEPERAVAFRQLRLDQQQEQRRDEGLRMKFVNADRARRREDQQCEPERGRPGLADAEPRGDAETRERHRCERDRLHRHEEHRVRPQREERREHEDDGLRVIAHERDVEQRDPPFSAQREPKPLHVKREVERAVLKRPPVPPRDDEHRDRKDGRADADGARALDRLGRHRAGS